MSREIGRMGTLLALRDMVELYEECKLWKRALIELSKKRFEQPGVIDSFNAVILYLLDYTPSDVWNIRRHGIGVVLGESCRAIIYRPGGERELCNKKTKKGYGLCGVHLKKYQRTKEQFLVFDRGEELVV